MKLYEYRTPEEYNEYAHAKLPFKAVWEGFKDNTTAHGIPHVNTSRGPIKSLFWTGVSLALLSVLFYNGYYLFDAYFSYPKNVLVNMETQRQLNFPAITVCNFNQLRLDFIQTSPILSQLLGVSTSIGDAAAQGNVSDAIAQSSDEDAAAQVNDDDAAAQGNDDDAAAQGNDDDAIAPSNDDVAVAQGNVDGAIAPSNDDDAAAQGIVDDAIAPSNDDDVAVQGNGDDVNAPINVGDDAAQNNAAAQGNDVGAAGASNSGETGENSGSDGQNNPPFSNDPPNADFQLQQNLMAALVNMTEQGRQALGHQLEDFILSCEYRGADCNITNGDFETFFNSVYGNCFTYNWGISDKDEEVSYRPGPMYGLKLVINIDQYMYIPDLPNAAGVRVVVHPQQIMPFPEDEGISAQPGEETYIGIRKLSLSRLGGVYGDCVDTSESTKYDNVFAEEYGCTYSQKACERTCYQKNVIETCNCSDPMYPNNGSAFGYRSVSGCSGTYDTTESACKAIVEYDYSTDSLSCDCPQPCEEETFASAVSTSKWPSTSYMGSLRKLVAESRTERSQYLADRFDNDSQDNLLKLVIYFQEFNYESIEETETYLASSFVGDLGGILGLYIGFSIMTILEFVELFLDVLTLSIYKCCSRGVRNKTMPKADGKDP